MNTYVITCKSNGRQYFGSSVDFENRKRQHIAQLNNNKHHNIHLQHAWNKYGEHDFIFAPLQSCETLEQLRTHEQMLLDYNRVKGINVFNISTIADEPPRPTPESIKKGAAKRRGRKATPEHCAKISKGLLGRVISEKHRLAIARASSRRDKAQVKARVNALAARNSKTYTGFVSPEGKVYTNIKNLNAFCREHGLLSPCMHNVYRGKYKHHKGWTKYTMEND
jgi:group I intron endonuclease